ncbi:gallidermin/nisin family lantibiotic [Clostridium beijerinckii]|nr:gallidermin/nisin family lantibiotic [Clostridium beijerinckii]
MGKLDDFDLDVKVKATPKGGVKPSITSRILCTSSCYTQFIQCHDRV